MANITRATAASSEVNVEDILEDYGLSSVPQTATVIQQNNNIVSVPNSLELEPPAILSDVVVTAADVSAGIEGLNAQELAVSSNTILDGEDPFEDDEEDEDDRVDVSTNSEDQVDEILATLEAPFNQASSNSVSSTENEKKLSTEELIDLLPVNSKSFEVDEKTSRFSGAEWFKAIQESEIILAGLGGIGSYVLYCLSRMRPAHIYMYDDDVVEIGNLSGQLYSKSLVGRTKVDAMAYIAKEFSGYQNVSAIPQKFTLETKAGDIMICGFDSMVAREEFFHSWVNHLVNHPNPENCLYIDGRLNMEEFQVYCIRGDDKYSIDKYNKTCLFRDYQAENPICSLKQTTYCSNMIGSIIVNLFTNFVANTLHATIERDLPFKTYYNASMMYFKTET